MSRLSPNGSGKYRVSLPGIVRQELKALHLQANKAGSGERFLRALRTINDRLTEEPLTFGDPCIAYPLCN
jgi:hypothetical protein